MKLLNKTIRSYLIYSFSILLITIPLFYFTIRSVMLHAVDHSLRKQLKDIRANLHNVRSQSDLEAWSRLDQDISLSKATTSYKDSIYTEYKFNQHNHENEPYRQISGIITVEESPYQIIISVSLIENEDLLGSILMVETVLLLLLMGGMLWINRITSQKLWRPFYSALKNIRQYNVNRNTAAVFKDSNIDEFNELNQAINNLFNRTSETYIHQKEFTENAAHEMQTPLAIFQSKLELLMQTTPLNQEQAQLIQDMEASNHRLGRLNKSLLLLAKIENNQFDIKEEIDITALTARMIRQMTERADSRGIYFEESYNKSLVISSNRSLVEILVINLLSNAVRYNLEHGKVYVSVDNGQLVIKNHGVSQPLSNKIFERFYKENDPAMANESSGLGLAIAENICKLLDFDIQYSFDNNLHCFTILFGNAIVAPNDK